MVDSKPFEHRSLGHISGKLLIVRFFPVTPLLRGLYAFVFMASVSCLAQDPKSSSTLPDAPSAQSSSSAQQPDPAAAPSPAPKSEQETKKEREEQAQKELKQEEQQHLLGVVPTYNAVYSGQALPLNGKQKFDLAIRGAITPYQFALTGIVAGLGQAQNSFPEYGQGMEGYAKRYGSGYADYFNGQMLGNALLPVLLHQDPRYFRKGTGKFSTRLLWAMASTVRCKGDNGNWQPNVSNVVGNIAAGGISNLYYPASDRGVGLTFERGMVVTAEGVVGAVLLEFTPDIQRYMFHRTHRNPNP
jgi:hypothetical protein